MVRLKNRIISMDQARWPKKIWDWDTRMNTEAWYDDIQFILSYAELDVNTECDSVTDLDNLETIFMNKNRRCWRMEVSKKPKLRTFEQIHDFDTHKVLLKANLDRRHHSLVTKLKSGVLSVRPEKGRYKGMKIHESICELCKQVTEDEIHFLFMCHRLKWVREHFTKAFKQKHPETSTYTNIELLRLWVTTEHVKDFAKWLETMYEARREIVYRTN